MLALTLSSCFSTGTVWDDTIPPEQSARVWFMYFVPKSYNGIDVDAKKFRIATLPAGNAEFSGDIAWSNQGPYVTYTFRSKDANFSCRFEGGEEYIAWVTYEREQGKRVWGIALYKEKIAAKLGAPDKKNLVAFIPFDPPVLSN
jgi:hypothetical protein